VIFSSSAGKRPDSGHFSSDINNLQKSLPPCGILRKTFRQFITRAKFTHLFFNVGLSLFEYREAIIDPSGFWYALLIAIIGEASARKRITHQTRRRF